MKESRLLAVIGFWVAVAALAGSFFVPEVRKALGLEESNPREVTQVLNPLPAEDNSEPAAEAGQNASAKRELSQDPYERALLEEIQTGIERPDIFNPRKPAELRRAVHALRDVKSKAGIPLVTELMERWSPVGQEGVSDLLSECVDYLVDLRATQSCAALARLSVADSTAGDRALEASKVLCSAS